MMMDHLQNPNEITRESLVRILEIMHRLAAPEAMPELLREIIEVGKVAIVAEAGVLWLCDRVNEDLVMVAPAFDPPVRLKLDQGWAGRCATSHEISNIHECREDGLFREYPVQVPGFETRSILNVPILGQDDTLLGVMQWLGAAVGQFDEHDEWVGPALAAQAAVAIQHSYMTDELLANAILEQEVAVAREIQMSTLPREMPEVPGYDVHGHFLPTDHTGGDLFDLVMLDGQLFMLLGDATGHGFGPALSATQMQAMMRVSFRLGADLDTAYAQVNNQLAEDLPDDRFITAFMGFLDPASHEVQFHSGGQGPILHFRAGPGTCDWYKPTNFPVGIMELDGSDRASRLNLEPGDVLALISDGVYEYADEGGEQFGEERVAALFAESGHLPMSELAQKLVDAAFAFGGDAPQADDITLVLV
ncbi:MAG: SpoIIE family protein phosphatase, partial [Xanthomonadales bacterium]|nr:SpoIIE family protein phosphatase [Xanthomonadales bacterium]NIX11952.1 SpoIIE family protein phosphatase [Xanthomonadales bacterium]